MNLSCTHIGGFLPMLSRADPRTRARQRSPLRISEELLPPGQRRPNIPEMPPPLNHHLSPCVTNVSMGSYYDYVEKVKSAIRKSYSKSEVEESPGCMIQTFAKEMHINVTSLREQLCRTVIRVTGAAKTGKTSLCAGIPQALHAHYQGKKRNWSKRRLIHTLPQIPTCRNLLHVTHYLQDRKCEVTWTSGLDVTLAKL